MQDFLDAADYAEWKRRCIKQRYIAAKNPAYDGAMATCVDFEISCGPWNLRLVLETYVYPAIWHASISYFKKIGDETIYDKCTGLPIFEAPQDALLLVREWNKEELDVARSLLGDLMGPLIPRKDTRVIEDLRFFAMHWIVEAAEVNKSLAQRN
jgi:hypothetical protein